MNYAEAKQQIINDRWRFVKLTQAKRTLVGLRLLKNGGIPWDNMDSSVVRNSPGTFQFLCYENSNDKNPRVIEFTETTKYNRPLEPAHSTGAGNALNDGISPAMVEKLVELERVRVELIQKTTQVEQQTKLIRTLNDKIEELEIQLSQTELESDEDLADQNNIWQDIAAGLMPHVIAAAPSLLDGLISKLKNNGSNANFQPRNETKTTKGYEPPRDAEYFEQ